MAGFFHKLGVLTGLSDPDGTSDVAEAKDAAQNKRIKLDGELANYQTRQVPRVSDAGTGVADPRYLTAGAVSNRDVAAPQRVSAGATFGTVGNVAAANRAPVAAENQVTVGAAPRIAGPQYIQGGQLPETQINMSPQMELRMQQLRLIDRLNRAVDGDESSVAQEMLRKEKDDIMRRQLSFAAGQSGAAGSAALKQAAQTTAYEQINAANNAAALRAQEIAQARQELAAATNGARGMDIGLATDQAQLGQGLVVEGAKLRAGLDTAVMTEEGRRAVANADNAIDVSKAQAGLDAEREGRRYTTDTASSIDDARRIDDVSKANSARDERLIVGDTDRAMAAGTTNARNAIDVSVGNADRDLKSQTFNIELAANMERFNVEQKVEVSKYRAQLAAARNEQDLEATLRVMALDDAAKNALRDAWFAANGQYMGAAGAEIKNDKESAAALGDFGVRVGSAIATGGASEGLRAGKKQ